MLFLYQSQKTGPCLLIDKLVCTTSRVEDLNSLKYEFEGGWACPIPPANLTLAREKASLDGAGLPPFRRESFGQTGHRWASLAALENRYLTVGN